MAGFRAWFLTHRKYKVSNPLTQSNINKLIKGAICFHSLSDYTDSNRSAGIHTPGLDFMSCSVTRIDFVDDHVVNIFLITYFRNVLITITRANQRVIGRARFGTEKTRFFEHEHQVT